MRVIEDRAELEQLPNGTVIRDSMDEVARKRSPLYPNKSDVWQVLGDDRDCDGYLNLSQSWYLSLPVEVLWEPE